MSDEFVTLGVHNEFARRIDEENNRQNHRIESLEHTVHQISELTTSVKTLAVNMENMLAEQKKQGERLEVLEGRDGEKWRTVASHVIMLVVGGAVAYFLAKIGL